MTVKILFVGHGLFRESLTRLLSERPSVEIVGAVSGYEAARDIVETRQPDVVIVDPAQVSSQDAGLEDLLDRGPDSIKVIYLTLQENTMVVHDRQHLTNATLADLMRVLRIE